MSAYYDHIRDRFIEFDDMIGVALVNALEAKASHKIRKDYKTPYSRHLLDQTMYTFSLVDAFGLAAVPMRQPMRVARLNAGHDHIEDLFENEAALQDWLLNDLGVSSESETGQEVQATVGEIRITSKHVKDQPDECSEFKFIWRVAQNPNTSAAKPMDFLHNGSTKSRVVGKEIGEQAEDADRVSRLMLHDTYPGRDGHLKRFRTIAQGLQKDQSELYKILERKMQHLMSIERAFHELHPDAQRPSKTTGIPIPHPRLFKPLPGFASLPDTIEPTHVLARHIKEDFPDMPFADSIEDLRNTLA